MVTAIVEMAEGQGEVYDRYSSRRRAAMARELGVPLSDVG